MLFRYTADQWHDGAMARSAAVDELIVHTPDWRGALLARLREIVLAADPEIVEDVKWRRPSNPLGVAVWARHGNLCAAPVLKERVRLSFFAGASLPDPHHLFNAQLEGKSHGIDFHEGDTPPESALKALVRAAVEHNESKARSA
jgi:hypothetical protein